MPPDSILTDINFPDPQNTIRRLLRANGLLLQSLGLLPDSLLGGTPLANLTRPRPRTYAERVDAVLAAASGEFLRGVREPVIPGDGYATTIDGYIRSPSGLTWTTTDVRTWKPNVPYRKNRDFAWCGAFAAWCWSFGGLRRSVRYKRMAGTGRLWNWVRDNERHVERWEDLRPGDLAVFDNVGAAPGDHITLVRELPRQAASGIVIPTYEGNAFGTAPPGAPVRSWEGVVINERRLFGVRGQASFAYGVHFDEHEDFDP